MSIKREMDLEVVGYMCMMAYYSAIKRNETESFAEMWMDLESVIQS